MYSVKEYNKEIEGNGIKKKEYGTRMEFFRSSDPLYGRGMVRISLMGIDYLFDRLYLPSMERKEKGVEMEKIDNIYKRIWELKTRAKIEDVKKEIQKLQQSLDIKR